MSPDVLRKLSDADLMALQSGDLTKLSDQGLQLLSGKPAAEPRRKSTEGMGTFTKIAANIGAGMADLGLGARQLWTDMTGDDAAKAQVKQEVEEKRRIDAQLAEDSFDSKGGKYAAQALQIGGNVLPTLVIPGGGAIQSGRILPLALRSAGVGAGLGAVNPVGEGESRAINMAVGGTLNAAAPTVIGIGNAGRRMVTRAGGSQRAGEQIAREITDGVGGRSAQENMLRQTLARLRNAPAQTADDIPLSTAAQLSDPNLARLEAGSRTRNGANWYDFDQTQARSVADNLRRATSAADDLPARRALRQNNIELNKAQAFSGVNSQAFGNELGRFRSNLDVAMLSPDASNPAVRSMLESVAKEIDRLGDGFGPEHLATIRANLSGKYNPMSPNVYAAAPRDSVATRSVLQEVDNILNQSTNNRWQNVVSGYARDSATVDASKAAGRVREKFFDEVGMVQKGVRSADPLGDVPLITEIGLGRAAKAARDPAGRNLMSDEATRRVDNILAALRRQNIVQGVKRSATAGGGSNTASDTIAAQAAGNAADAIMGATTGPAAPIGRGALQGLRKFADENKDRALAEALQNPDRMIEIIERQLARGEPLTPAMEYFLRMASGLPAAAAVSN
jgi:hypothetical protein